MAIEITKDYTTTKAKAYAKATASDIIMNALIATYGEDNVAMVRKPSNDGKGGGTNFIAAIVDTIEVDGESKPLAVGVTVAGKDPVDRTTKSGTVEAFDFYELKANYENWLAQSEAKKAAAAKKAAKVDTTDTTEF
jgi:hypothetical protein